jgi:hypothetical protein
VTEPEEEKKQLHTVAACLPGVRQQDRRAATAASASNSTDVSVLLLPPPQCYADGDGRGDSIVACSAMAEMGSLAESCPKLSPQRPSPPPARDRPPFRVETGKHTATAGQHAG